MILDVKRKKIKKRTVIRPFNLHLSANQGLEKLRSVSNLRKISGPAHLIFFSVDLIFKREKASARASRD